MSRELPRLKSNVFRYINIYHRYIVLREWLSQNGKSYIIIILIEKWIKWMTYPTISTTQVRAPPNSCYGHVAIMWRSIVRTNKQTIVPNLVFFVFCFCFCFVLFCFLFVLFFVFFCLTSNGNFLIHIEDWEKYNNIYINQYTTAE